MIWGSDANQLWWWWWREGRGGRLLIAFSNLFISCPTALNSDLEGRKKTCLCWNTCELRIASLIMLMTFFLNTYSSIKVI